MFRFFMLVLFTLPAMAFADGWEVETFKDTNGLSGKMRSPGWDLTIYCGQVLSEETGLYEENIYSGAGYLNLVSPVGSMGPLDASPEGAQPVFAYNIERGVEQALPTFYTDDLNGEGWIARIKTDHPVIQDMLAGHAFSLMPKFGNEFNLFHEGMAKGLEQIITHCEGSAPKEQAASTNDIDQALFGLAQTQAFSLCQAAYELPPTAYISVDVTGDGVVDLVVNFQGLKCTAGPFAGRAAGWTCAGQMCRHDVYSAQATGPIVLMGTGIAPVTNRPGDIRLGMDAASCTAMSVNAGCSARMRWMAQTFGTIGLN